MTWLGLNYVRVVVSRRVVWGNGGQRAEALLEADCQGVHSMWFMHAWNDLQDLCIPVHHLKRFIFSTEHSSSVHRAGIALFDP